MDGIFGMSWSALWDQAMLIVASPVLGFVIPSNGYYWGFFVSAAVIAVIAYVVARPLRDFSTRAMIRAALNPQIWLAKSARADYRFWIINGILFPLIAVPATVTAIGLGLAIAHGLSAIFGPIEAPIIGPVAIRVAFSIAFFVMLDFGHYVAHLAQHKIPLLWEFHKVHHSAEVLTPITSTRFHPIDLYILNTGRGIGAAIATGIFYYLGAGEVTLFMVFGAHVAVTAYQAFGNLRHSHVWVSYGPLNHILVSPAMHQIHPSKLDRHIDRNCGWAFSIWDRLFGTLYVPREREEFPMGLGDGSDGTWHGVWTMYSRPMVAAAERLGWKKTPSEQVLD